MSNSHFDEKSGVVCHETGFGKWHQTVDEVMILVDLEPGTRGKEVHVDIQPNKLKCSVRGKLIFEVSKSLYEYNRYILSIKYMYSFDYGGKY